MCAVKSSGRTKVATPSISTQQAQQIVDEACERAYTRFRSIDRHTQRTFEKVLKAMQEHRLSQTHFTSADGYGHADHGVQVMDNIYASVFGAESGLVRIQFVSGTHAIAAALFGVLRPGDEMLSVTGRVYDTLEEVVGLRGHGNGSLRDFGISYSEVELKQGRLEAAGVQRRRGAHREAGEAAQARRGGGGGQLLQRTVRRHRSNGRTHRGRLGGRLADQGNRGRNHAQRRLRRRAQAAGGAGTLPAVRAGRANGRGAGSDQDDGAGAVHGAQQRRAVAQGQRADRGDAQPAGLRRAAGARAEQLRARREAGQRGARAGVLPGGAAQRRGGQRHAGDGRRVGRLRRRGDVRAGHVGRRRHRRAVGRRPAAPAVGRVRAGRAVLAALGARAAARRARRGFRAALSAPRAHVAPRRAQRRCGRAARPVAHAARASGGVSARRAARDARRFKAALCARAAAAPHARCTGRPAVARPSRRHVALVVAAFARRERRRGHARRHGAAAAQRVHRVHHPPQPQVCARARRAAVPRAVVAVRAPPQADRQRHPLLAHRAAQSPRVHAARHRRGQPHSAQPAARHAAPARRRAV
ncbi:aluminum resistance [Gracilaria domingensis]|nr:aluminum resistance [Gracilaria domingensis]